MTTTYATFVAAFPEFAVTSQYAQTQVEFWLGQAPLFTNQRRFTPEQLPLVTMLYAAHNLVLGRRDQQNAATGGTPGEAIGPTAAKSVDKVSVSYGPGAVVDDAGEWNLTSYGMRLWRLMRGTNTATYVPGYRRTRYPGYSGLTRGYPR